MLLLSQIAKACFRRFLFPRYSSWELTCIIEILEFSYSFFLILLFVIVDVGWIGVNVVDQLFLALTSFNDLHKICKNVWTARKMFLSCFSYENWSCKQKRWTGIIRSILRLGSGILTEVLSLILLYKEITLSPHSCWLSFLTCLFSRTMKA